MSDAWDGVYLDILPLEVQRYMTNFLQLTSVFRFARPFPSSNI